MKTTNSRNYNLHSVSNETNNFIDNLSSNEEKDKYIVTDLQMIIKENFNMIFNNNLKKDRTGEPMG